MFDIALTTFDPTSFFTLPPLTARSVVALSLSLRDSAPTPRPIPVDGALEHLGHETGKLEGGLDSRRRDASARVTASEFNLDGAGDGAWVYFRDILRGLTIFARPGFVTLADDEDAQIDYADRVDKAARAQALLKRLFGRDGLSFLRYKYTEQAVATASILRIIEEDQLAKEIDAVAGDGTVALLNDLQWRYEEMVNARTARERSAADDLKLLSARVRQAIQLYAIAVMGMINPADPNTVAPVQAALRPILNFREQAARARTSGAADDPDAAIELDIEPESSDEPEHDESSLVTADEVASAE